MLANYHTHTSRCNHAIGEDREYVESAIANGMKVLGFSDHCPFVFEEGFVSPIRMTPGQTDGYFNSLLDLKREYQRDITIYIGFESEYLPELIDRQDEFLKGYPVDYMIMGQHFLEHEKTDRYTGRRTNIDNDIIEYVDLVIEGFESGRYKYVAHPDLINYIGPKEIYHREMKRLCEYLKNKDIPVEINMLGLAEFRHYPNPRFLSIASEVGNKAIIGCDAHSPDFLNESGYQEECMRKAKEYGLELVNFIPGLEG